VGIKEDDILPDDGSIPRPILMVLLVMLFTVGIAGSAAMWVVDGILAPFGFAVARAFLPPPRRPAIRATEQRGRGPPGGARDGFRPLADRGVHGLRARGAGRLPARPPRPRLPRRR